MNGKPWSKDEDLAVLYLKETYREQLKLTHPALAKLAGATNRNRAAIWMRKRNFDSLDPSVPGRGLTRTAQQTVDVWATYQRQPEITMRAARAAYHELIGEPNDREATPTTMGG